MKTFNLAIATLAIAAAASTSAFASSLDQNGNIPNHESNIAAAASATDSYASNANLFVDRTGNPAGLTQDDSAILKLRTSGDTDPRVRTQ